MKKLKLLFVLFIFILCVTGCTQKTETQDGDVKIAKTAVSEAFSSKFVIIPDECIVFVSYDSKKDMYKFKVDFDPKKIYPEVYDEDSDVDKIRETIYVQKDEQCYSVYDESEQFIYTYYDRQ